MNSSRKRYSEEYQCIEHASAARIASAQRRLADLRKNGTSFSNPLSGFTGRIDWKEDPTERIKQVLFIPVGFVLILFLALLVPFAYMLHLWDVYQKKRNLEKEILLLGITTENCPVPTTKTLESLWQFYGLDKHEYNQNERLALLLNWIKILYGDDLAEKLDLEGRVNAIIIRHVKINMPYYDGESGAAHFYFMSPVDSLIRELTEELPEYTSTNQSKDI